MQNEDCLFHGSAFCARMQFLAQIARGFFLWTMLQLLVTGGNLSAEPATAVIETELTSPLMPIKTDHPRDTMTSYLGAMNRYVTEIQNGGGLQDVWLNDAVRCFDLSGLPTVGREETARLAAILLKETIDRIIVIEEGKIPDDPKMERWRLRHTEIAISRQDSGPRKGEFLFTSDTVERAEDFFAKVKHLPLLKGTLGGGYATPWQEQWILDEFKGEFIGLKTWQWVLIGLLIFVGLVLRQITRFVAFVIKQWTARTESTLDDHFLDALAGPITHLSTTGVWFASLHLIGITGRPYTVISFLIKGAFFVNLAYLSYKLAGLAGFQIEQSIKAQRQDVNQSLFKLLRQSLKILALIFCLLLGAQNMGMDVASLVAGLGIGGLAFALAARDTLANLFGFIMIMLDRPFRVGDWIIVQGTEGTVEDIGFRCTRLRTFYNSLVSIPNNELVITNIDNMGMREYRRVKETLGITYGTPVDKIEAFCDGIKNIVNANPHTRKDNFEVSFHAFGPDALNILVLFFFKVPDWRTELRERQKILLEFTRLAESLGVSFAFPTQTVHIASAPGSFAASRPDEFATALAAVSPGPGSTSPTAKPT